ncbi:MAG: hypothetical protein KJP04_00875 [Arenicella sp.]|nr:hypothetical protein [Arenicella sp.]
MLISIHRKKFIRTLVWLAAVLIVVHSVVLAIYFYIDDPDEFDFVRLVDMDYEGNLPTLFSVFLFFINSVFLYLIYRIGKHKSQPFTAYWLGLACIFLFLGIDEGTRLHEELGDLVENFVDAKGVLYFPWVIPYVSALFIAGLIYFRFFLTLERPLQVRLMISAALFLSGAVGVEMISANEADQAGTSTLTYSVLYTIEETLEMAGLIFFAHTLLLKLDNISENISLKIG